MLLYSLTTPEDLRQMMKQRQRCSIMAVHIPWFKSKQVFICFTLWQTHRIWWTHTPSNPKRPDLTSYNIPEGSIGLVYLPTNLQLRFLNGKLVSEYTNYTIHFSFLNSHCLNLFWSWLKHWVSGITQHFFVTFLKIFEGLCELQLGHQKVTLNRCFDCFWEAPGTNLHHVVAETGLEKGDNPVSNRNI